MPIVARSDQALKAARLFAILALALVLWSATALHPSIARQPNMAELWNGANIDWKNVGPGIRESSTTGKPVIMVFHAAWCGSCSRYREVWKDPGVVAASKNFVMILVDVDADPDANGAFSPDGTYVPRTIFYDSEGEVMKDVRGRDPEYPHTIDLDDPTELRLLMLKAAGKNAPDRRAAN